MFSRVKCPHCGARNSKERITCVECGAPLTSEQAKVQSVEFPSESKSTLASSTKTYAIGGGKVWFWVGVTLLSISGLWWLLLILVDPGDISGWLLTGVVTTIIPIGIGIYCLRRGRKPRAVQGMSSEQAFATHDIETIDRERIATKRPVVEKAKVTKGMNKGRKPKRYIGQCTNHPDAYAVETCIHCGKIICAECAVFREEDEEIYCISCMEKLFTETSLT